VATEIGIEPTVRHSLDIGYLPIIVTDTCGARNAQAPARSLAFTGGSLQTEAWTLCGLLAAAGP
jgi:nicotinamidase-related amidase